LKHTKQNIHRIFISFVSQTFRVTRPTEAYGLGVYLATYTRSSRVLSFSRRDSSGADR